MTSPRRIAQALVRNISEKAASALGEAAGQKLVTVLWNLGGEWYADVTEPAPPTVSALAVRAYLEESSFAPMARRQVVAWAMWELSQTDANEAEIILRTASMRGDPESAVDAIVAYFGRIHFGIVV